MDKRVLWPGFLGIILNPGILVIGSFHPSLTSSWCQIVNSSGYKLGSICFKICILQCVYCVCLYLIFRFVLTLNFRQLLSWISAMGSITSLSKWVFIALIQITIGIAMSTIFLLLFLLLTIIVVAIIVYVIGIVIVIIVITTIDRTNHQWIVSIWPSMSSSAGEINQKLMWKVVSGDHHNIL